MNEQLIVDTEWVQAQIDAATGDLRRQLAEAQAEIVRLTNAGKGASEMIWTDEWIAIEAHRVAFLANGREAVAKIGMTMIRNELQAEIERLTAERDKAQAEAEVLRDELRAALAEIDRLTNAGLDAAYGETIKADEANDYFIESERLRRQLEKANAIIERIDRVAPRANSKCQEPGITLSEATRRTLRDEGHPFFVGQPAATEQH